MFMVWLRLVNDGSSDIVTVWNIYVNKYINIYFVIQALFDLSVLALDKK